MERRGFESLKIGRHMAGCGWYMV